MISAAPFASSSSPTTRPSSRGRSAGPVRCLDDATTRVIQHPGGKRHLGAPDLRMARDRRIAVTVEHPQHLALGIAAVMCERIVNQGKRLTHRKISRAAFDRDDALPYRRKHFLHGKFMGGLSLKPFQPSHANGIRNGGFGAVRSMAYMRSMWQQLGARHSRGCQVVRNEAVMAEQI
jgi:hypothetical protein